MMRRLTIIGLAAFAILLLAIPVRRDVHGLTLVVCAADMQGIVRRLATRIRCASALNLRRWRDCVDGR